MEGRFADAANNHGFKRARWRRLWRQKIQDYMIATVQNVRILLKHGKQNPTMVAAALGNSVHGLETALQRPMAPLYYLLVDLHRAFVLCWLCP